MAPSAVASADRIRATSGENVPGTAWFQLYFWSACIHLLETTFGAVKLHNASDNCVWGSWTLAQMLWVVTQTSHDATVVADFHDLVRTFISLHAFTAHRPNDETHSAPEFLRFVGEDSNDSEEVSRVEVVWHPIIIHGQDPTLTVEREVLSVLVKAYLHLAHNYMHVVPPSPLQENLQVLLAMAMTILDEWDVYTPIVWSRTLDFDEPNLFLAKCAALIENSDSANSPIDQLDGLIPVSESFRAINAWRKLSDDDFSEDEPEESSHEKRESCTDNI